MTRNLSLPGPTMVDWRGGMPARGLRVKDSPFPAVLATDVFALRYGKALVATGRAAGEVPVYGSNGQCGWHDISLFKGPGIILGRKGQGPLGVEWCASDYWVIDTAYTLQLLRADVDLKYAYYLVKYVGLNHLKDGTSNPSLSRSTFGSQIFPLPPFREQRAIARILGALDDKIELNRKMNSTLEEMTRALFKSWFVDFDPVHAKAAGKKPYGMDDDTAALFPGSFEESELGLIPRGWKAAALDDHVTLKRGTTYKGILVGEPGPALLGLGSIRPGGGFRSDGFKTYGGDCPPALMLRPGELYVSLKGATKDGEMIGSVARVPRAVLAGRLTQDTVKLEIQDKKLPRYLYRLLLTPEYRTYCANRAMGSAVVALSREDFLSYQVVLPNAPVLQRFDVLLAALEDRGEQCESESYELASLRDTLLPKLLSGELRIKDAERLVGRVA